MAQVEAMVGDAPAAWETIKQLVAVPSAYNLRYLAIHPAFTAVVSLPEFQAALRQANR